MLEKQYGTEIANKIIDGYTKQRKATFRVNTLKSDVETIERKLIESKIEYEKVAWSKEAFIIKNENKKIIQELDIYKNGEIYMQSLSSMLPPIILKPQEGADILDMAAAPGGKTTQMAALSNNKAHITACEKNKIRAERLKYNIDKQSASCVFIMTKDARYIDDFFSFDQILLDAPCSGSGTLNINDEKMKNIFTRKLIDRSISSQIALLNKALKILKPGKEMVYSTCSVLANENEDVIKKVINNTNAEIIPIDFEGVESLPTLPVKINGTLCICPNELYEGFFVAKIRKK
jgi:NOL1/NOP2/sun family putative RNA methylase